MKKSFYILLVITTVLSSCSTQKSKWFNRAYHNTNAHYNAYFNGKESLKEGVKSVESSYVDDYKKILPIYRFPSDSTALAAQTKRAIAKASKVIQKHSIYIKKKEYCNWIDDAYLLIGKSNFYKHQYELANENFEYVSAKHRSRQLKYEAFIWLINSTVVQADFVKAIEYIDIVKNDQFYIELIETKEEKEERIKNEPPSLATKKKKKLKKIKRKNRIKDGKLNHIQGAFEAAQTNYYIQQKDYPNAIEHLEIAIEKTRKKKTKKRYKFILAQLYQKIGDTEKSYKLFEEVAKKGANYEMEFNAKIQQALAADAGDSEKIKKILNELAQDDKNKDYLGQIYFALANVYYKEGDTENAITTYKLSAQNSEDAEEKSISYLRIAEMQFKEAEYKQASVYYDSTMAFLPESNLNFELANKRQKALARLVKNMNVVTTKDSLLMLSKMTDSELKAHIREQEKIKEDAEFEKLQLQQIERETPVLVATTNKNAWYFYNNKTRQSGVAEFLDVWGSVSLQDNWRRSAKSSINFDDNPVKQDTSKQVKQEIDVESFKKIVSETSIPTSDKQKEDTHKSIQQAMYNMALVYKEDLKLLDESAEVSKKLLDRYEQFELKPSLYYHLYRVYRDKKSSLNTTRYKKLLLTEYPDSEYAKILFDPQYTDKNKAQQEKEEKDYKLIYNLYLQENFKEIDNKLKNIEELFTLTQYQSKAYYLKALSIQKLQGNNAYKKALQILVLKFPNAEVSELAKQTLALLR